MRDDRGELMTHSFDAGAAWENLALEGTGRNLVVHAMGGFDHDKAREVLGVPDEFTIECMIAVGKKGKKEDLSEVLQEREVPSLRKPLEETVFHGRFQSSKKVY